MLAGVDRPVFASGLADPHRPRACHLVVLAASPLIGQPYDRPACHRAYRWAYRWIDHPACHWNYHSAFRRDDRSGDHWDDPHRVACDRFQNVPRSYPLDTCSAKNKGHPKVAFVKNVRRRPTLPRSHPRSTIGAEGLSFRVRNGAGRFPFAMAAETLLRCGWCSRPNLGNRTVDAN